MKTLKLTGGDLEVQVIDGVVHMLATKKGLKKLNKLVKRLIEEVRHKHIHVEDYGFTTATSLPLTMHLSQDD